MRLPVTPSTRLLLVAGALVAGEACGFALHGAAVLWPWLTFLLGFALLAAYGWGARGLLLPTAFAAGIVLAARTEAARLHVLDATRFVATPPLVAVRVESPVRLCRMKRAARDRIASRHPWRRTGPAAILGGDPLTGTAAIPGGDPLTGTAAILGGALGQRASRPLRWGEPSSASRKAAGSRVPRDRRHSIVAGTLPTFLTVAAP